MTAFKNVLLYSNSNLFCLKIAEWRQDHRSLSHQKRFSIVPGFSRFQLFLKITIRKTDLIRLREDDNVTSFPVARGGISNNKFWTRQSNTFHAGNFWAEPSENLRPRQPGFVKKEWKSGPTMQLFAGLSDDKATCRDRIISEYNRSLLVFLWIYTYLVLAATDIEFLSSWVPILSLESCAIACHILLS